MKLKITDTFPTAKIYIDDKEIDGVIKYRIKRRVGKLPVVVFTMQPCFMEIDLSKSIKANNLSCILFKINCLLKHFMKLIKKCSYKNSKSKKN